MNDDSSADLMAAILELRDATAARFANADAKFDATIDSKVDDLRYDMNRRFDRMDERFDRLEGRVAALEPYDNRPAS